MLLGERGLVGYMCGLNMVAIHIVYQNIIKYHMAYNIRVYNDSIYKQTYILEKVQDNSIYIDEKGINNTRKMNITIVGTETNTIMIYVLYNVLFILQGARILSLGGGFGRFMESRSAEISSGLFNSTVGSFIRDMT